MNEKEKEIQFQERLLRRYEKDRKKRLLKSEKINRKFNKSHLNPLSLVKINLTGILQNLKYFTILTEENKQFVIKDCIERTNAIAKALRIKINEEVNQNAEDKQ